MGPDQSVVPEYLGPFDESGDFAGNPHAWLHGGGVGMPGGGYGPAATIGPAASTGTDASDAGPPGLQVVEPPPSLDLVDAVVGGVAGTFFGD